MVNKAQFEALHGCPLWMSVVLGSGDYLLIFSFKSLFCYADMLRNLLSSSVCLCKCYVSQATVFAILL